MKQLMRNIRILTIFFLLLSIALLGGLIMQQHRSQTVLFAAAGENKEALFQRYALAGDILTQDGVALAHSTEGERQYAADETLARAVVQLVGDYTHNIGNTIESVYQSVLLGTDRPLLRQFKLDLMASGLRGDDVVLTINSELETALYELLAGERGAGVLLNYATGDVLAQVSLPSTDPYNVIYWEDIPDTALFNRALRGEYLPGSTFKIITAAAWNEQPAYSDDYTVVCSGSEFTGPGSVTENRDEGADHGEVNAYSAFRDSCNHYFGQAGLNVGATALVAKAEEAGFNRSIGLDRLHVAESRIISRDDDYLLTWLAIGQAIDETVLSVTPLHLAMIAGAVGNNGVMMEPHIVHHLRDARDAVYDTRELSVFAQPFTEETAAWLEELMLACVTDGTGVCAARSEIPVAGKTGTAQSYNADGELVRNSLFCGYSVDRSRPYAVAIVLEDSGTSAAWVAGEILARAASLVPES